MTATCPVCGQLFNPIPRNRKRRQTCGGACGYVIRVASRSARSTTVDPVAVYRLTCGDPPPDTTRAERIQATSILTHAGRSLLQIAELMRVTPKSVSRYRHELIKPRSAA
jgi:hypothetical protein